MAAARCFRGATIRLSGNDCRLSQAQRQCQAMLDDGAFMRSLEVGPKPKLTGRDDMIITYWKRVFDG